MKTNKPIPIADVQDINLSVTARLKQKAQIKPTRISYAFSGKSLFIEDNRVIGISLFYGRDLIINT